MIDFIRNATQYQTHNEVHREHNHGN